MSVSFQSEVQKKKKKMSICGTILPKIFNRKLRGSAAKEQKIKIALLLKKKKSVLNSLYIKSIKKEILKAQICPWRHPRTFKDFLSTSTIVSLLPEKTKSLLLWNICVKTVRKKRDLVVKAQLDSGARSLELCYAIILPCRPGQVQSVPKGPALSKVCLSLKNADCGGHTQGT